MTRLRLNILRTLYCICCAGTLLFAFLMTFFSGFEFGKLTVVMPLMIVALCFLSAVIVRHAPKLTRFGIASIGLPILGPLAKIAIIHHF